MLLYYSDKILSNLCLEHSAYFLNSLSVHILLKHILKTLVHFPVLIHRTYTVNHKYLD